MSILHLTVNQRLSQYLQQQEIARHRQETVWPTTNIMPVTTWLQQCWQQLQLQQSLAAKLVLSTQQEWLLWQQIMQNDSHSSNICYNNNLVSQVQQAWQLLHDWRVPLQANDFIAEQQQQFYHWAQQFQQHCQDQHWLSQVECNALITTAIQQQQLPLPTTCYWHGFDELSPALQQLQQTLQQQGVKCITVQPQRTAKKAVKLACPTADDEYIAMARWAKQLADQQPTPGIACIVTNLAQARLAIERSFRTVLKPERHDELVNISVGKPLASYAIVHTARQILMLENPVPLETISQLIRTPFLLGAEQEYFARQQFDYELRRNHAAFCDLSQLQRWLAGFNQQQTPYHAPLLQHIITALAHQCELSPNQQTSQAWYNTFSKRLHACGWPGERQLSSHEYQTVQCFFTVLTEFTQLGLITPQLHQHEALQQLNTLCESRIFQPQATANTIQVMGMLEAAGMHFDHLWLSGCTDKQWPSPPKSNPFIPYQLQQRYQLPHANSAHELAFCQQVMQRLQRSSQNIVISYAQQAEDEVLQPSSLIANLNTTALEQLPLAPYDDPIENQFDPNAIEYLQDVQAPPLRTDEKVHGGSSIFKLQATCPFRAFATLRLDAHTLEQASIGFTALERGTIVHRILELLWRDMGDQANLLALSADDLKHKITTTIATVLNNTTNKTPMRQSTIYSQLEQQRLHKLIQQWLQVELQRPAFQVLAQEQDLNYSLAGFELKLQIDRIDQLADGSLLLIDYKTGKTSPNDWFGERPNEPQLPLYCIALPTETNAISFAYVHSSGCRFNGVSQAVLNIAGMQQIDQKYQLDWPSAKQHWQTTLTALANDFANGHAAVDPKDVNSCTYCELHECCRIADRE